MSAAQPSQSSSASGSSSETIGNALEQVGPERDHVLGAPVGAFQAVARRRRRARTSPGPSRGRRRRPACSRPPRSPRSSHSSASAPWRSRGANPPSSPTAVAKPFSCRSAFSAWKTSAPQRSAFGERAAPTGITMNSWSSSPLSACAPPLITFIIGVGQHVRVRRRPDSARAAGPATSAAARATAIETPRIALAPSVALLSACRRASSIAWSTARWSNASSPITRRRDRRRSRCATAVQRRLCRRSGLVAVAQLDRLVLARGGAARARPRGRTRRRRATTSTSTVGLPRESRISRA